MPKTALVLVDFQNERIDGNSPYFLGDLAETLETTTILINYARQQGMKIIFTRHVELWATDAFVEGSIPSEIISALPRSATDIVITKHKISPFYQTDLEAHLADREEIIICGILTNLCVRSCIQDAYDRDFAITVVTDCCVSIDEVTQQFTLQDLQSTREEIDFTLAGELISR